MSDISGIPRMVQMVTEGWGVFFCIIASIVVWQTRVIDRNRAFGLFQFVVADGVLLLSDMISIAFRGYPGTGAFYIVRISTPISYLMGYLVIIYGVAYFGKMIEGRVNVSIGNWKVMEYVIAVVGACMILINLAFPFLYSFDESNQFRALPWNMIIHFTYLLGVILIMVLLLNFFKDLSGLERFAVISALILPVVSFIVRNLGYEISLTALSSFAAVVFTFVSYMIDYTAEIVKREREREKWIAEENIRLLHDQIKPHFIYNALTGIYYGLDEDISRSKKALKDLSGYLRGSLDVLDARECVDFSLELGTVKCYLDVESFRFDDQINVDMDIEDMDFQVPAFCIQTLVENAVRHGIRKKNTPEGNLTIRSFSEDGAHVVTISDDGIGFDIDEAFAEKGVHIGLKNTKKRLELMCDGTMEIESEPGVGTKIRLVIPERRTS